MLLSKRDKLILVRALKEKEINDAHLMDTLVGSLYPGILAQEIQRTREMITELEAELKTDS